jgi:hypothetical protein
MKLHEVEPGSIVVLDDHGAKRIVELGAILVHDVRVGRKKVEIAHAAIVHDLDDQSFRYVAPRNARGEDPDLDVVFVVASVHWLRRLRDISSHVKHQGAGKVRDPLQSGEREADAF